MINFYSICTVYITLPIAPKIAEKKEEFVKKKKLPCWEISAVAKGTYMF